MIKRYFPILLISIIVIVIYFQAIIEMVAQWWDDPNYSHGFLIPIVSAYLIWQKKEMLENISRKNSNPGLIIIVLGAIIYILGTAAAEFFTARFSLVLVIFGIILFYYGKEYIEEIWFPILFLLFMIPIPYVIYYSVTFPMQLLSSQAASTVLQLAGLEIVRQGNIINLPNYSLEVVEACSGLRSLMTLSALGAAMAYMTQKTTLGGTFLFLLSVPIAIGANVFRIVITALGAYYINPKLAEGFLHEVSGLIVFLVGFISLGITGTIINWIGEMKDYNPIIESTDEPLPQSDEKNYTQNNSVPIELES
ncbi:MAG: exosortase/archaeosortase family protein [bacterium]|nr:MAG: exosortase/archaeosortase family protein [bacterium]